MESDNIVSRFFNKCQGRKYYYAAGNEVSHHSLIPLTSSWGNDFKPSNDSASLHVEAVYNGGPRSSRDSLIHFESRPYQFVVLTELFFRIYLKCALWSRGLRGHMRAGHESRALGLYFTNKLCLLQTVRGNGPAFLPLPTGSAANGHRLPAAAKGRTSGESTTNATEAALQLWESTWKRELFTSNTASVFLFWSVVVLKRLLYETIPEWEAELGQAGHSCQRRQSSRPPNYPNLSIKWMRGSFSQRPPLYTLQPIDFTRLELCVAIFLPVFFKFCRLRR